MQIQQVLLNLAMNGMDAMMRVARPRELIIRSEKHGEGGILVAVEDHGPGIASEIAARIFEPFFSTKPQGTGMGLAICRSIIEAHDGRIWAENLHGAAPSYNSHYGRNHDRRAKCSNGCKRDGLHRR